MFRSHVKLVNKNNAREYLFIGGEVNGNCENVKALLY